jgi:hypothetical protein
MIEKFNHQRQFTKDVLKRMGYPEELSEEDRVSLTRDYILYIISECNDLLQQIDWKKHWKTRKPVIKSNVGIEIIDIQKYLWGLSYILGIDSDEFMSLYDLKSVEVESKWHQEIMMETLAKKDSVCIIDIDGVLAPYPDYFISWVRKNYDKSFSMKSDPLEYERYKHLYRELGAKRTMPFITTSRDALNELRRLGYTIVLLTNRPYNTYHRIYSDTIEWLRSSEMSYDYIFWAEDKKILSINDKCKCIKFVVDDRKETCNEFRQAGIKAYQYGKDIKSLLEIDEIKESVVV